jgi:hypothetical protein
METTQTKDPWKDKYGYDIPRCRYISLIGAQCEAAPITGDHFCPEHHPAEQAKRYDAYRNSSRNLRREAPLVVPVGLPRITLQTPEDAGALFVETINFVRTGEMDYRVASTLGYLTMGWLHSIEVGFRIGRQVVLDDAKAAEKAEKKQAQAAAQKEAQPAAEQAPEEAEPKPREHRDTHGPKPRFTDYNVSNTNGENARTQLDRTCPPGSEFVSATVVDAKPPSCAGQTAALGSEMATNGRH